ncbi:haloacid dehalogenase [Marinomonas agarivorans]|nr:haloacid dehalogenase [Marinomonas agarivorans]
MTVPLTSFSDVPDSTLNQVRFILTDIDDTLTWNAQLPPETYQALHDLSLAGYIVIPVTGGCGGWSDLIARLWPVAGVITEGGAVFLQKDSAGKLHYHHWQDPVMMQQSKMALLHQVTPLLSKYPALKLAQDQAYRLTDVAVDYAQDVYPPAIKEKEAFLLELQQQGLQAKASSIHINIWQGEYDKYAMAVRVLSKTYGLSKQQMDHQVMYVGDAPNDESMFAHFPLSVGVANIAKHLTIMCHRPNFITQASGGYGFAEIAKRLLQTTKP